MDALALSQIDYFEAVVSQRADKQSLACWIAAKWSIRPSTPGNGIVCFNLSGAAVWALLVAAEQQSSATVQTAFELKASSIVDRRGDFLQTRNQKRAFDCLCQILGAAAAPIMEKHHARLFVGHVLVDRDDVDFFFEQRSRRWLQFIFCDREVAIDNGVVVAAGEGGPSVHAHGVVDLDAVHCCRSAERELDHSVF